LGGDRRQKRALKVKIISEGRAGGGGIKKFLIGQGIGDRILTMIGKGDPSSVTRFSVELIATHGEVGETAG